MTSGGELYLESGFDYEVIRRLVMHGHHISYHIGGSVGYQDIVRDADGETWMLYHSWTAQSYRRMNIDRLVWEGGAPAVQPHGRTPQPAP